MAKAMATPQSQSAQGADSLSARESTVQMRGKPIGNWVATFHSFARRITPR